MPKLYHKKSPNGCTRCKKRRVKCDEEKPSCGACSRHAVSCEYGSVGGTSSTTTPTATDPSLADPNNGQTTLPSPSNLAPQAGTTTPLELRLFHFWLTHTCSSFAINVEYFKFRVPLLASEHRVVLDGILAMAALHLHRCTKDDTPIGRAHRLVHPDVDGHLFMAGTTSEDMLQICDYYLNSAIRGHREAFANPDRSGFEAVYMSSALITLVSTFLMGVDSSSDDNVSPFDEAMWFRLGVGPRELIPIWQTLAAEGNPLITTGVLKDGPDLSDNLHLFNPSHSTPFTVLLTWASEFETLSQEEQTAYENTVSYLGLTYQCLKDATEHPLATSRRFIAFPARAPPLFSELALQQKPRALVILAHVFAIGKLLSEQIPWYVGIAEQRIPAINERLPAGWKAVMQWPLAILARAEGTRDAIPEPPSMADLR